MPHAEAIQITSKLSSVNIAKNIKPEFHNVGKSDINFSPLATYFINELEGG